MEDKKTFKTLNDFRNDLLENLDGLSYVGFDSAATRAAIQETKIGAHALILCVMGFVMVGNNLSNYQSDKKVKNVNLGIRINGYYGKLKQRVPGLTPSRLAIAYLPITACIAKLASDNGMLQKQFTANMPTYWEVAPLLGPHSRVNLTEARTAYKETTVLLDTSRTKTVTGISDAEADRWIKIANDGIESDLVLKAFFDEHVAPSTWTLEAMCIFLFRIGFEKIVNESFMDKIAGLLGGSRRGSASSASSVPLTKVDPFSDAMMNLSAKELTVNWGAPKFANIDSVSNTVFKSWLNPMAKAHQKTNVEVRTKLSDLCGRALIIRDAALRSGADQAWVSAKFDSSRFKDIILSDEASLEENVNHFLRGLPTHGESK